MHPVLKRILWHGGLTAVVLAVVGVMFAKLANQWLTGNGLADAANASLHTRIPLTLAAWGFALVVVGELILWRVRGTQPAKPTAPPDDAEKLLNELLAQAEAKTALEAESQRAEHREPKKEGAGSEGERGA